MASYFNSYIDNLWKSMGMPPVLLPGTSPPQYSRTPSVFLPALVAAVLPTPTLNALVDAWNALQAKLTGAPPVAATVPAVTAGIVATDGVVTAATPQVDIGAAVYGLAPIAQFVGNSLQVAQASETLANELDATTLNTRFAPLLFPNLASWGANAAAMTTQVDGVFTDWVALSSLVGGVAPTATTFTTLQGAINDREAVLTTAQGRISNCLAVVQVVAATTLDGVGTEALTAQSRLNDILLWVNANSGGASVYIAAGAPFLTLDAWATTQGI